MDKVNIKVDRNYKFRYQNNEEDPWKCVNCENGWAVLTKMVKDHTGNNRLGSTTIETPSSNVIELPESTCIYFEITSCKFSFYLSSFTKEEIENKHVVKIEIDARTNKIIKLSVA